MARRGRPRGDKDPEEPFADERAALGLDPETAPHTDQEAADQAAPGEAASAAPAAGEAGPADAVPETRVILHGESQRDAPDTSQRREANPAEQFQVGQTVKARYRGRVEDGWTVAEVDVHGRHVTVTKEMTGPQGSSAERQTIPAAELLAMQAEEVTPEHGEPDPAKYAFLDNEDFYLRLQVSSIATTEEIEEAYRRIRADLIRDYGARVNDLERYKRLNEAYSTLHDRGSRTRYNQTRANPQGTAFRAAAGTPPPPEGARAAAAPTEGPRRWWNRMGDWLRDPFGRRRRREARTAAEAGTPPPAGAGPARPEAGRPAPERPMPLDGARDAYAKAMRKQLNIIGWPKGPEMERLYERYANAVNAELQRKIARITESFQGRDLNDEAVQREHADLVANVILLHRFKEETLFRESMHHAATETAYAKTVGRVSNWLKQHPRFRLGLSAALLAASGLTYVTGNLQASERLLDFRAVVTGVAAGNFTGAALQLIEQRGFRSASRKRTDNNIADLDGEDLLDVEAAHELKYTRCMNKEFGVVSLGIPFTKRASVDNTGQKVAEALRAKQAKVVETEVQRLLQESHGSINDTVIGALRDMGARRTELEAVQKRSKKERWYAAGNIVASWTAGGVLGYLTGAKTAARFWGGLKETYKDVVDVVTGHQHELDIPSGAAGHEAGEFLGRRPGIPVDENAPGNMGMPVDGHGAETAVEYAAADIHDVGKEEGIEHVVRRLLEQNPQQYGYDGDPNDAHAVHEWSGGKAHRLAIKSGFVHADKGTEEWVRTPGTKVYLDAQGNITVNPVSDLYEHASPHAAVPHATETPTPEPTVEMSGDADAVGATDGVTPDADLTEGPVIGPDGAVDYDAIADRAHATAEASAGKADAVDVLARGHAGSSVMTHADAADLSAGADHAQQATEARHATAEISGAAKGAYEDVHNALHDLHEDMTTSEYARFTRTTGSFHVRDVTTERSVFAAFKDAVPKDEHGALKDLSKGYWKLRQAMAGSYTDNTTLGDLVRRVEAKH